jgi:hypothetical protein
VSTETADSDILYPATTGEDTKDMEDLMCAVVRSRVGELARSALIAYVYGSYMFNKSDYKLTPRV